MMKFKTKLCTVIFFQLLLLSQVTLKAQEVQKPAIWGIAKLTTLVSSFDMVKNYYGRFLGFDEAFSYNGNLGKIVSYKVNDRQFLEFVVDTKAKEKNRLVSVSFETENVEQMRQYLKSKGITVPDKTNVDGAGNEVFTVTDPSGNNIEFISFGAKGLHKMSKGRYLSDHRISERIHHVGLYVSKIGDDDPFYAGVLKCRTLIRYPEDKNVAPVMIYLGFEECAESIEHYSPNEPNTFHPCFLVEDMQTTLYTLKEREINESLSKPAIGKGKRWILNITNSDNTRVEFTEPYCVK